MSWDWEKLKEQQQSNRGVPPQVDEIVSQLKKFKLPSQPNAPIQSPTTPKAGVEENVPSQ